jgi:hypothetical protein
VTPFVWRAPGHDHLVTEARGNHVVASRTPVLLHRLVRLHVLDLEIVVGVVAHPNTAHSTKAATTINAAATTSTSVPRFARARNGFKPTTSP